MAKAIACEAGLNFFVVKEPELFNKFVWESERAVREVFRRARFAAQYMYRLVFLLTNLTRSAVNEAAVVVLPPAIARLVDSVSDRMVTTLLNELDGVEELTQVAVIAANNKPDIIDKVLLRPGRLGRIIYVSLPDETSRREILLGCMTRMPIAEEVLNNVDELIRKTEGYSGAELVAVC